jgi:hypothetical protein
VVVFAALAGMLGAYFLEVRRPDPDEPTAPVVEGHGRPARGRASLIGGVAVSAGGPPGTAPERIGSPRVGPVPPHAAVSVVA